MRSSARVPLKDHAVTAFKGRMTYRILFDNADFEKRARKRREEHDSSLLAAYNDLGHSHEQYKRLINLLAAFAFYSGLGAKTGQGMGMVRQVNPI